MVDKIKHFFAPPVFEDEEKTRTAYLLNFVTWAYLILAILAMLGVLGIVGIAVDETALLLLSVRVLPFLLANILGQVLMRSGRVRLASTVFVILLWMGYTGSMVINGGTQGTAFAFFFLLIVITGLLLDSRAVVIALIASICSGGVLVTLEMRGLLPETPIVSVVGDFIVMSIGFSVAATVLYLFLHRLNQTMADVQRANTELRASGELLEVRVAERTRDLAVAAEIGRTLSQIQDIEELLKQSVNLIHDRYNLYYTQIYLTTADTVGSVLTLRAGTGTLGRQLLQSNHYLPIATNSLNGVAVIERRVVLVEDTAVSDVFRPHPQLPDTRSELVIPLIVGDRVIGTVDMQSAKSNTFTAENSLAFEAMGNQLAVAIDNANLFTERQHGQKELRASQSLFSDVINNATSIIYIKQTDGKYILVNRQYKELFDTSNEEVNGKTDYDLFSADVADTIRKNDLIVLGQEGAISSEEEIPHPDGIHTYISVKFPLFDEQGKVYAVAGVSTDITDVKAAEIRLAERVAQLDLLNAIGRKVEKNTPIPEFLEWAAAQIPSAMSNAAYCTASIQWKNHVYGDVGARHKLRHIIEEMRVQSDHIGYIAVAYDDPALMFVEADSALLGGIGQRIGAYLQGQLLLEQMQVHNDDLQMVTEIGTAVSSILDPAILLKSTVERIRAKFDLYQVAIFLADGLNQELILSASAGQVGKETASSPIAIKVSNSQSVIARVAQERKWVLVNDVKSQPNYTNHPLLSETAAELAIPIQIGERLLGVLDVQSVVVNAFSEEKAIIYTALATQVAVALQNARQYERTQIALNEVNVLQKAAAQEGWRRLDKQDGFLATASGVEALTENGRLQIRDSDDHIIMPMRVRGAQIGNIAVRVSADDLSDADQDLLNAVSSQVADALERTRFFEEIEEARHRTETLYNIGRVLPTVKTSNELLRTIADGAAESVNANQILLLLCDVEKRTVVNTVAGGLGRESVGLDMDFDDIWNGLSGWTLREGKTAFSPKFARDERESVDAHEYRLSHDVGSLIVVPLIYQDKILGTLTAINRLDQSDFTAAEAELLTAFGVQATVAIENRNLLNETEKRAGREQTLREITTRVNNAVDAESVLQTAVKEVGQAMGLEIFAYLDDSVSIDSSIDAKDAG